MADNFKLNKIVGFLNSTSRTY